MRREGREPLPDHAGESPLLSRSGGEKGPCSDSSATPSFPSQPEGKIGLPRANPRGRLRPRLLITQGRAPLSFSGFRNSAGFSPCQVLWVLSLSCFSDGKDPCLQRDCPLPDGAQADGASSPPSGSVSIPPPGCRCPASVVFSSLMPTVVWAPPNIS